MLRDVERASRYCSGRRGHCGHSMSLTETGEAAKTLEQNGDENTATWRTGGCSKTRATRARPWTSRARTEARTGASCLRFLRTAGDDAWFKDVERDPGECASASA